MTNKHGTVGRTKLVKLAKHVCVVAYSDSHVKLDEVKVREAIEGDMASNGFVITEDQINVLIMGDDEGEVPEDLTTCFSGLNAIIAKEFE